MGKKIAVAVCQFFFLISICSAATVYLRNGKKIEGKIVDRDNRKVMVDVSGLTMTYYQDEIDRIEESAPAQTEDKPPEKSAATVKPAGLRVLPPGATRQAIPLGDSGRPPPSSVSSNPPAPVLSKRELILSYIEATGEKQNMQQKLSQTLSQLAPADAEKVKTLFNIDEILEELIPVYDKYFTEEDLKSLIAFYKGPLFKKLTLIMPMIREDIVGIMAKYLEKKMPGSTGSAEEKTYNPPVSTTP